MNTPLLWTSRFAAVLGLTSLTLTGEIAPAYLAVGWAAWLAGFFLDRRPRWEERLRAWETAAVLILISAFLLDFFYWGFSLFVTVAHFLLLFQTFKLVGAKTRKDCLQVLVFSFFQMLSACTLSVDAWQALILLLLVPTATAGLFWQQIAREAEDPQGAPPPGVQPPYRKLVTMICVAAIPVNITLAAAMFIIFPRLAFRGAFAGLGAGRSGYSEQVNLDQTGEISANSRAVMWLEISPRKDRSRWKGYLRGTTLDFFDGKKWSRNPSLVTQTLYANTHGIFKIAGHARRGLRQSITLVNVGGTALFGSPYIGEIVAPLATLQSFADGSVRWSSGWRKPLRYDVISYDEFPPAHAHILPNEVYLQLPARPWKRTKLLARQIAGRRTPAAQAKAIEAYLRERYSYSLHAGDAVSEDPVEDFLFVRRRGPCGHFASAMAVMLRLQNIPARVVAGYYKGSWNNRVGQYLIRESDAHAWVEAYFPGSGWVSFDPSPRSTVVPKSQRLMLQLQEYWQFANYQWDRLIIEYDLYSQVKVVEGIQSRTNRMNARMTLWIDKHLMGFRRSGGQRPVAAGGTRTRGRFPWRFGLVVATLLTALGMWQLRKRPGRGDPAIAFYEKFLDRMARRGWPKAASETGWEYARRLQQHSIPEPLMELTERYYRTRFRLYTPRLGDGPR